MLATTQPIMLTLAQISLISFCVMLASFIVSLLLGKI